MLTFEVLEVKNATFDSGAPTQISRQLITTTSGSGLPGSTAPEFPTSRRPMAAAALLRRLAPHVSGGATHRRVPPPIASSLLARFSSAPTTSPSSPPSSSSAAGRDEAADEEESPEISNGDADARLSIAVDRSGLYNPPGPLRLCFSQSRATRPSVWV